ncbi:DNA translocase FtsK 4TM domain-containing protein [Neisseria sp. ZJ106]|uniref:DNA translocase FtsK 4TM domain-containing protein n=1 Tax=Neisseria lisongii TaxID=2912188 RepID=A0ABY7RKN1_9NEIS|nr:DNA translocase FtsK [Neisseria lisongii]MCF7521379.1 DNA translocase FtsK 4TM domain-containing protein [Neisseria lisongii]WCL71904.1 DNA translocase FtsK 4TM domain-containing protein [Neisseria lisongii]
MATKNVKKNAASAKKQPASARSKSLPQSKLSVSLNEAKALKKEEQKKARPEHVANLLHDASWLFGLVVTVYLTISLFSFDMADPAWSRSVSAAGGVQNFGGLFGAYLSDIGYYLCGMSFWWLIAASYIFLYKNFRPLMKQEHRKPYNHGLAALALLLLLVGSPIVEYFALNTLWADSLPVGAGGVIGVFAGAKLEQFLGKSGSLLIMAALVLLAVSLLTQVSWLELASALLGRLKNGFNRLQQTFSTLRQRRNAAETVPLKDSSRLLKETKDIITAEPVAAVEGSSSNRKKSLTVSVAAAPKVNMPSENRVQAATGEYQKPSLSLLAAPSGKPAEIDPKVLEATAERIETKLAEFGLSVQVVSATAGPTITRFEIEPAKGVKGSQIVALAKDLARTMSVQSIRIVETIAGKNTMGIELPNEHRQEVGLGELLSSEAFTQSRSKLAVALGKDITGTAVIGDLAKMPHLLVAGMTGSGKSVGVNGMILSMLYNATPEEVRFVMIDPKMLEFSIYEGIPHLLCPVVTDMREAGQALNWCVAEMEKRYRLLSHAGVRNLDGFNQKVVEAKAEGKPLLNPFSLTPDNPEPLEKLPQIVVVIDELADLMMTERKTVEQQIVRLAQKSRAAGIHLIIATQRPSVDVITGLIKSNIPTRLAFTVTTAIDSRTIIDQAGANELLKYGDCLFSSPGSPEPVRLQGAFVSDEETLQIVEHIKSQAPTNYIEGLLSGEAALESQNIVSPNAGSDELFDQAVAFVLESRKTSISALQRQLRIGYNRAANLMEALENAGVVTPPDLGGNRKIITQKDLL